MSNIAFDAVCAAIERAGGWIPFEHYVNIVLHNPQVGFYGSGRVRFGNNGDFVTAPHISPLFAKTLAQQAKQILKCGGEILEIGAGDGHLAAALITELPNTCRRYRILETSAALQLRQKQTLATHPVEWISTLPDSFCGIIIANEVLDALPFGVFLKKHGTWQTRGVACDNHSLQWREQPLTAPALLRRLDSLDLPDDYQTEMSPHAEALVTTLCAMLKNGVLLLADYGFGRTEYYHPQRNNGTLMCHRSQMSDSLPLESPGDKDITTHVDWTAIAEAGLHGGGNLGGYTTQAHFLLNCGITEILAESLPLGDLHYAQLAAGAQKLLLPHEMGELFKFMAFTKGDMPPLLGFLSGCRRRQL